MQYFETVPRQPGLNNLPSNPFNLLNMQLVVLAKGESYQSTAGDREILAVLLGGNATFVVDDCTFEHIGSRPNVFAGKPSSVYIPAGAAYRIIANGALDVALVSAPSTLRVPPYVITPDRVAAGVWGVANFARNYHQILTEASQPDLPAQRLIVGETYMPSGNWSTYPPHRHEQDDLPREAYHEELYFFKINPPDGFGIARYYDDEIDTGFTIRDNTILMVPRGYHTVVSGPGYTTYYLWALAGNQRTQATVEDPALSWVGRTVPMLRALGH